MGVKGGIMQLRARILLIASLVVLTGCAGLTKTTEVTGESIVALGNTYASTATAMTNGCVAKAYTVAQCDSFRAFGLKFRIAYPLAKDGWNAASAAGNKADMTTQGNILSQLAADLAPFTATVATGK
jgi:hypothetical protein